MIKIRLMLIMAFLLLALACAPGSQAIPAGPVRPEPAPQSQEQQPAITPVPEATPAPTTLPAATPKGEQTVTLRTQSLSSAKITLEQDSTFRFDGIKESIKLVGEKSLEEGKAWEFTYDFESRYPGYGDRAGKIMAAVITPHKVRIVVREGMVTEAVMDEKWDMLGQKMIEKK